jgi:hypothetical protein
MSSPVPFYRAVLRTLRDAEIPFLIGGTYALARYTAIDRSTKDLDLMVRRRDWPAIARALREQHIYTRLPFPHWLGKALHGKSQVDVIFSGGNGLTKVDDEWIARGVPARVLGFNVDLSPPEELLWSKAFVMERERFDGADVLHLILAMVDDLDWRHLCERISRPRKSSARSPRAVSVRLPDHAARLPRWLIPALARCRRPRGDVQHAPVPGHAPLARAIPGRLSRSAASPMRAARPSAR